MQLQYHYLMSDRMRTQLLYSRFVNMHTGTGRNKPCDLHMEHLNRYTILITLAAHIYYMHLTCIRRNIKVLIGSRGANINEDLVRLSRLQQPLHQKFDSNTAVFTTGIQQQRHSTPRLTKDIQVGANSLQREVFTDKGRVSVGHQKKSEGIT